MGFDLMSNFSQFFGGGSIKPWNSGETVSQWDYRRSPLDGEIYQRKTAAGSGTTDPADDVANYVAVSYNRPAAIVNEFSAGGSPQGGATLAAPNQKGLSVAPVANTRTLITSVTGKGRIQNLAFRYGGAAGRPDNGTARIELVLDGRTLFNALFNTGSAANSLAVAVVGDLVYDPGTSSGAYYGIADNPIEFARSFQIFVTNSWTYSIPSALVMALNYQGRT